MGDTEKKSEYSNIDPQSSQNNTQTAEDCCLIEKLPNNCLIEIFLHLTEPQDKLNCELVSKRWNKLAKASWSNITDVSTMENIDKIVRRAGKYLRNVSLICHPKLEDILRLMAENCKRIERFSLLFTMAARRHFSLVNVEFDRSLLKSIIRGNQNLRSLEIVIKWATVWKPHDFEFMDDLLPSLEKLVIEGITMNPPAKPVWNISRFENLQILSLRSIVVKIRGLENLSNLKHLEIYRRDRMDLSGIQHHRNLEYLSISSCSPLQDDVFERILKNNKKLKFLEINSNTSVTDASFQYVQQLPELKVLIVTLFRNVTDNYFSNMPSVRLLRFDGCCQISDRGFKQFLDTANDIEIIVALSTQLTVNSVISANEWTKRTGKALTLYFPDEIVQQFRVLWIGKDHKLSLNSYVDERDLEPSLLIYKEQYSPVWPEIN